MNSSGGARRSSKHYCFGVSYHFDLGDGGRFLGRAQPFTKSDRNREEASP